MNHMTRRYIFALLLISLLVLPLAGAQPAELKCDRIVIHKSARRMELIKDGKVIHSYKIALGGSPIGHKEKRGDQKTPEGVYMIDARNAASHYHKSLHVSYPNLADRAHAKKLGVDPGGDIYIHGIGKEYGWLGPAHAQHDWTLGCIAVTNNEIDEIWKLVSNGTTVEILP
jgi:murein L,D-transpeptidase YafK